MRIKNNFPPWQKFYQKIEISRAFKNRVLCLWAAPLGAVHSDFSEANPIFLKFYALAAVFSPLFCCQKSGLKKF